MLTSMFDRGGEAALDLWPSQTKDGLHGDIKSRYVERLKENLGNV